MLRKRDYLSKVSPPLQKVATASLLRSTMCPVIGNEAKLAPWIGYCAHCLCDHTNTSKVKAILLIIPSPGRVPSSTFPYLLGFPDTNHLFFPSLAWTFCKCMEQSWQTGSQSKKKCGFDCYVQVLQPFAATALHTLPSACVSLGSRAPWLCGSHTVGHFLGR